MSYFHYINQILNFKSIFVISVLYFSSYSYAASTINCANENISDTVACSIDFGVYPNDDSTADLTELLNNIPDDKTGVFFPKGRYNISENVTLRSQISLYGSEEGLTVFKAAKEGGIKIGNNTYMQRLENITIENIAFDNVVVDIHGELKKNITVVHNTFVNTTTKQPQLALSHSGYKILGNIFLRGKYFAGLGISTYKNTNTLIEGNFFGNLSNSAKATNYLSAETKSAIQRVKTAISAKNLTVSGDQGYFRSAWYATDELTNSKFSKNFIVGFEGRDLYSRETKSFSEGRDHIIYIKQYTNVIISQNYFKGWPNDASGQTKFRNATGLYFVGNYLDNCSFNARPYDHSPINKMNNTIVFNNFIKSGQISYWQNFTDDNEHYIDASNYLVFNNIFTNNSKNSIASSWRSKHGEFLNYGNKDIQGNNIEQNQVFTKTTLSTINSRIAVDYKYLQALKPINIPEDSRTLSRKSSIYAGSVKNLNVNDIVYFSADSPFGKISAFLQVSNVSVKAWHWPSILSREINSLHLSSIKIGEKNNGVIKPIASSYRNEVWADDTINNIRYAKNVYQNVGSIDSSGKNLKANDRVCAVTTDVNDFVIDNTCIDIQSDSLGKNWRWPSILSNAMNAKNNLAFIVGDKKKNQQIAVVNGSSYRNKVWLSNAYSQGKTTLVFK